MCLSKAGLRTNFIEELGTETRRFLKLSVLLLLLLIPFMQESAVGVRRGDGETKFEPRKFSGPACGNGMHRDNAISIVGLWWWWWLLLWVWKDRKTYID